MSYAACLERLEVGRGFLFVSGWVGAPRDAPWPAAVVLRIGPRAVPITGWFPRPDLPDSPDGPLFRAFAEDIPWPGPDAPAAGAALHLGDAAAPLAVAEAARWAPFVPSGSLEAASQAGASGWLLDPAVWHGGPAPVLLLDGHPVLPLRLDVQRPDIRCGATLRGQPVGFFVGADALGRAVDALRPFRAGARHRWSVESSGAEVAMRAGVHEPLSRGRLEGLQEGVLRGWAALQGQPQRALSVAIEIEGVPFATLRAGLRRDDLGGLPCGFALPLRLDPSGIGAPVVAARIAGEAAPLPGSGLALPALLPTPRAADGPWRVLSRGRPRVSVVVPVHDAPEDVARCLAALVERTTGAARLIVLDDASTDPRIAGVLAPYRGMPGVLVAENPANLGFTATCNRGIALAGRDDVVLLNSDAEVPPRWLEGLVAAAYSAPDIASATPLSDNAGPFSVAEAASPPAGFGAGGPLAPRRAGGGRRLSGGADRPRLLPLPPARRARRRRAARRPRLAARLRRGERVVPARAPRRLPPCGGRPHAGSPPRRRELRGRQGDPAEGRAGRGGQALPRIRPPGARLPGRRGDGGRALAVPPRA
ncbi:MAG: glycosyltransferase, partial [Acetobacteraceae bacterium]|nr:glycosyltransferase [Acetobacteraceae bacterium]